MSESNPSCCNNNSHAGEHAHIMSHIDKLECRIGKQRCWLTMISLLIVAIIFFAAGVMVGRCCAKGGCGPVQVRAIATHTAGGQFNCGPGGPNCGMSGPSGGPNCGPGGPNCGPGGPNCGMSGPSGGPGGPNCGPGGPNCGMSGPSGGQGSGTWEIALPGGLGTCKVKVDAIKVGDAGHGGMQFNGMPMGGCIMLDASGTVQTIELEGEADADSNDDADSSPAQASP